MRKEISIAIVFGLIVGLIITIGMYRARTALQDTTGETPQPLTQDIPSQVTDVNPIDTADLRITEPANESMSTVATIHISGATFPDSTIVVLQNESEIIGLSDSAGNFSIPITLQSGANIFRIRAIAAGHPMIEKIRTVVYETTETSVSTGSAKIATGSAVKK